MNTPPRIVRHSSDESATEVANRVMSNWSDENDDIIERCNSAIKKLLQDPSPVSTDSSVAFPALDCDKSEKLNVHDNSNQPGKPETAETKSDSNKSDVADATTCPDILDAHLPPLPRVYPLASLRNLMFERVKKQWRFVVDERDESLYRTEASLWTFDLDSVRRNGGFSLPPASISTTLQGVTLTAKTRKEVKRKDTRFLFCKLMLLGNSNSNDMQYKLHKRWTDSANDDYFVSSVQPLPSKHTSTSKLLIEYPNTDSFLFSAAGTLTQPSATGGNDSYIAVRVELWAASMNPFDAEKSVRRPMSVSLSSPIRPGPGGAAANAGADPHNTNSAAYCKPVVARLRKNQLRHLGSALVPVYWCRNAKVAQPILRADSKSSTLRSVANITITLNVDWMAGAGFLRAAVPVEIKPSNLNNKQVKDVSTVAEAATNATNEQSGDNDDAGDSKTDADDIGTDVTAGSDAGPGGDGVTVTAPDTDASDTGLWERPQGFERLVMPLGKQGSLSIVPPGIPSPRTKRPSVFPRIFVNENGSCVLLMQLFFHVELGEALKRTKLMAHMPETELKAMSSMRVYVPMCAVGTFPLSSKLQRIMARRLHLFYQSHLRDLTTADEIWHRATDLLASLRHALTGPTPYPDCLSPRDDATLTLTLQQEVQELTRAHGEIVDQFGGRQHQFCSPDDARSNKPMEWNCCGETGASCDLALMSSKHYIADSPAGRSRRGSGCALTPSPSIQKKTLSRPTAFWSTPITPIMAAPLWLPPVDVDFLFILQRLPAEVLLTAFVTALTDGSVVLLARSVDSPNTIVITSIFEALQCLLWPLNWVNPYIPLLPRQCRIPPFPCMCGFVVGHSEEGGQPDLEGLDRYIVIDLDADKSDPEAMICHSAGVLELPISLTDPLLCAAHAAITLNQCLDTMDPTDRVGMEHAWRGAILRLRLAAVGIVNSVLWRLPVFCRPKGAPKPPNSFLVYKRQRIHNDKSDFIELQKRPGVNTNTKDDPEGENSVQQFSAVNLTRFLNSRDKPFAFLEGVSTRTNKLIKGYLPTSMLFPTNDIFVVQRGDDEEKTWLRSEPTADNNSKVMLPTAVQNGARVRVRWWSPDKNSIPLSVFGWVWCFSSGKQGYIRREYLTLCTAFQSSANIKAHAAPSQLNRVACGVLRNPDVTPRDLLEYLTRRFGSQHLLNEHPMMETLLKQIKSRRQSLSGCSVVMNSSPLPDASTASMTALPTDTQVGTSSAKSSTIGEALEDFPQPATASEQTADSDTNTVMSPAHDTEIDTDNGADKHNVTPKPGSNSDLEPGAEPEEVEFDRLQFLRQFAACEDGYGRSGVALELAARTTESQPFEELKEVLLECVQQTVVSGSRNVLTPFEAQHWLCM